MSRKREVSSTCWRLLVTRRVILKDYNLRIVLKLLLHVNVNLTSILGDFMLWMLKDESRQKKVFRELYHKLVQNLWMISFWMQKWWWFWSAIGPAKCELGVCMRYPHWTTLMSTFVTGGCWWNQEIHIFDHIDENVCGLHLNRNSEAVGFFSTSLKARLYHILEHVSYIVRSIEQAWE